MFLEGTENKSEFTLSTDLITMTNHHLLKELDEGGNTTKIGYQFIFDNVQNMLPW